MVVELAASDFWVLPILPPPPAVWLHCSGPSAVADSPPSGLLPGTESGTWQTAPDAVSAPPFQAHTA